MRTCKLSKYLDAQLSCLSADVPYISSASQFTAPKISTSALLLLSSKLSSSPITQLSTIPTLLFSSSSALVSFPTLQKNLSPQAPALKATQFSTISSLPFSTNRDLNSLPTLQKHPGPPDSGPYSNSALKQSGSSASPHAYTTATGIILDMQS